MKTTTIRLSILLMAVMVGWSAFCTAATAQNHKIEVFVIGDSLSDTGNLYDHTGFWPPSPPYAQRYSNGIVWPEHLAGNTGVPVTSYAYGGALSGVFDIEVSPGHYVPVSNFNSVQMVPGIPGLPGVAEEVAALINDHPEGLNPDALYVIWTGSNDFFLALANPAMTAQILEQTIVNVSTAVCALGSAGANHFAVGNVTDIGLTPYARSLGSVAAAEFSYLIDQFNVTLEATLASLPGSCAETLLVLDTFGYLNAVVADPSDYGISNVDTPCIEAGFGADCSEHIFWDTVHPTTAAQSIFADLIWEDFCGNKAGTTGLRGRPDVKAPPIWRGACYGTP